MAVYMGWAFRGIEYEIQEAAPALLGFVIAFMLGALIATPIYRLKSGPDAAALERFAFRVWAVTATLVAIGWMVFYARDAAAAGEFRDNVIIGGVIMAVLVTVLNFVLAYALDMGIGYFMPKRRGS